MVDGAWLAAAVTVTMTLLVVIGGHSACGCLWRRY